MRLISYAQPFAGHLGAMELIIVRHGEPDLSGEDLSDPPLTDLGQRQAQATADFLATTSIDAVYISPQRRAQQTAAPLLERRSIEPVTDQRIAEFDYELGSYVSPKTFEGMTRQAAMEMLLEYQGPPFQNRVRSGFEDIINDNPSQTVAVVCHGGVINAVVKDVLEAKQPLAPNHASVTRVAASRSGVRSLRTFNEHHWLVGL